MSWLLIVGLKNALLVLPLAALAVGLSRWTKRPALAHLVWVLVLVKMLTPPLVDVPIGWRLDVERWLTMPAEESTGRAQLAKQSSPRSVAPASTIADCDPPAAEPSLTLHRQYTCPTPASLEAASYAANGLEDRERFLAVVPRAPADWLALVGLLWLIGSVWSLGLMVVRAWRFHRFLRVGGCRDEQLEGSVRRLMAQAGLFRQPRVVVVSSAVSPMLWGLGSRATLVFPARLAERLTGEEMDSLLLHELAHFARGDHWVRLLELAAHIVYWWHPMVWLARRQIELAEEACCDAWVVEQQAGSPRRYAEALLTTIDFLSEPRLALPPAACGLGEVPFLKQRLRQIVRGETGARLPRAATVLVISVGVILSPLEPALWATSSPRLGHSSSPPSSEPAGFVLSPTPAPPPPVPAEAATNDTSAAAASIPASEPLVSLPMPELILPPPPAQWAAAHSPDGRYQLVARTGRRITLRHEASAWQLDLSAHAITCASFSPDGNSFVTGHDDGLLRWWDSATGGLLADPLPVGSGKITSIAMARDGQRVACGTAVGRVSVWNVSTGQEESHLDSPAPIACVRWSGSGDKLAVSVGGFASADESSLLIWNPAFPTPQHELALDSPAGAIAWRPADDSLIAADWSGQSVIWTFATETLTVGRFFSKDMVSAAAWSPDCPLSDSKAIVPFPLGAAE